jgi:hypothetical protein
MATCVTGACSTRTPTNRAVPILRWTFRRGDDTVVCELGLNGNESAYELRLNPPWHHSGGVPEQFDDAMSAFQRHAEIERVLVSGGWMLEEFETARTRGVS